MENSYPTINNGRVRVDDMEKCGHYQNWRNDFDLVEEMGIRFLRYGPPIHATLRGVDNYDWSFVDETLRDLQRRNFSVIIDLCHFGLPDWLGNDYYNANEHRVVADGSLQPARETFGYYVFTEHYYKRYYLPMKCRFLILLTGL